MEDERIIELFFQRNEDAVTEAQHKYKTYCAHIALNLISNSQDAEECVNDVFLTAWKRIPPEQPRNLKTWLGKVTHDSAVNLWKKNHRQKRYAGITQALDELQEAVPDFRNPEQETEAEELKEKINLWLSSLTAEERKFFLRRYWHGASLKQLAKEKNVSAHVIAQKMYRLRLSLKAYLEKEEYFHG